MNWRRLLIDGPARAFDLWWTAYRLILGVAIMIIATLSLIALVLQLGFGIRWGW